LLTFNVSATDADYDTIIYGTNATNGTINTTTGEYSWLTNLTDAGIYVWYFNSSDPYNGNASETMTVNVTVTEIPTYLPPGPVNLSSTQGNFWINHTWKQVLETSQTATNVTVNGSW